jgi:hypothetical protein
MLTPDAGPRPLGARLTSAPSTFGMLPQIGRGPLVPARSSADQKNDWPRWAMREPAGGGDGFDNRMRPFQPSEANWWLWLAMRKGEAGRCASSEVSFVLQTGNPEAAQRRMR